MSENTFACVNEGCVACEEGLLVRMTVDNPREADGKIACQACGEDLLLVNYNHEEWMRRED